MVKKILLGLLVLVLLVVGALAAVFVPIFGGNALSTDVDVTPHVHQSQDGYVNFFILDLGDGVALVDAGNDASGAAVLAALKAKNREPKDVKAVFLTHGHPDHIAACHLFPTAAIYGFEGDVKGAAGEVRFKGTIPSMMDIPKEKTAKVTHVLQDGEVIPFGSTSVKAYLVPGHTDGSAAFLFEGVLFLGDNANARADLKTLKPAPGVFSVNSEQNKAELKKLHARLKSEAAVVTHLAYGHSGVSTELDGLLTAN